MMAKKHRVVLEIATSRPIHSSRALSAARALVSQIDLQARPIWPAAAPEFQTYATKLTVKDFRAVVRGVKDQQGSQ
jgi:hypothetical protein